LREISRAGRFYQNYPGRNNFSWWRLIGPVFLREPHIIPESKLPWEFVTTFFPIPTHDVLLLTNKTILKKPTFSSFQYQTRSDQHTFSLNWISSKGQIQSSGCFLWLNQTIWSLRLFPFSLLFIAIVSSFLRNGFNTVKRDFVYALYQIIR
jgi:hypothetical protein